MLKIHGRVFRGFSSFAALTRLRNSIKPTNKLDCMSLDDYDKERWYHEIGAKIACAFGQSCVGIKEMEIFCPTQKYPDHVDSETPSISFFIPLEPGEFILDGLAHPVIPYVLYEFPDNLPHNSNFASIMITPDIPETSKGQIKPYEVRSKLETALKNLVNSCEYFVRFDPNNNERALLAQEGIKSYSKFLLQAKQTLRSLDDE